MKRSRQPRRAPRPPAPRSHPPASPVPWREGGILDGFKFTLFLACFLLIGVAESGACRAGWGVTTSLAVSGLILVYFLRPHRWTLVLVRRCFRSSFYWGLVALHGFLLLLAYYLGVCLDENEFVSPVYVWSWSPVFLAVAVGAVAEGVDDRGGWRL